MVEKDYAPKGISSVHYFPIRWRVMIFAWGCDNPIKSSTFQCQKMVVDEKMHKLGFSQSLNYHNPLPLGYQNHVGDIATLLIMCN